MGNSASIAINMPSSLIAALTYAKESCSLLSSSAAGTVSRLWQSLLTSSLLMTELIVDSFFVSSLGTMFSLKKVCSCLGTYWRDYEYSMVRTSALAPMACLRGSPLHLYSLIFILSLY